MIGALALIATVLLPFGGPGHRKTEEGNRLYVEGRYDDALRSYTEAQEAEPDAPELFYDIGNVLYRQQDFEGAAQAFTRALTSASPGLVGPAAYNLGNARFRLDQFKEAAAAYRRALEADPRDADAKRNLELSLLALEQQRKDDSGEGEPNEESDEDPQQQPQQQQGEQDPSQQQQQQQQQGEEPPPEPQPRPQEGEPGESGMTREQAERLLDGLEGEEEENLRRLLLEVLESAGTTREKDW